MQAGGGALPLAPPPLRSDSSRLCDRGKAGLSQGLSKHTHTHTLTLSLQTLSERRLLLFFSFFPEISDSNDTQLRTDGRQEGIRGGARRSLPNFCSVQARLFFSSFIGFPSGGGLVKGEENKDEGLEFT